MKKLLIIAFLMAGSFANAQTGTWSNPGTSWAYDFSKQDGKLGLSVTGDGMKYVSTVGSATFLSSPSSGSLLVSSVAGAPSFTLVGKGTNSGLKINSSSKNGNSTKFAAYDIAQASAVVNLSFNLTIDNNDATKENWYFAIGRTTPFFNDPTIGLAINKTGSSSNAAIFAAFRLITDFAKPELIRFQVRTQESLEDEVGWTGTNTSLFKKGGSYKIEMFNNNSSAEQIYQMDGQDRKLAKRSFHIWVNGKQIGGGFSANGIPARKNLDAFVMMSRDASYTGTETNNSAAIVVGNVKLNYAASK